MRLDAATTDIFLQRNTHAARKREIPKISCCPAGIRVFSPRMPRRLPILYLFSLPYLLSVFTFSYPLVVTTVQNPLSRHRHRHLGPTIIAVHLTAADRGDSFDQQQQQQQTNNGSSSIVGWDWQAVSTAVFENDTRPIVLFDGVCNLCNAGTNFAIDHDPEGTS